MMKERFYKFNQWGKRFVIDNTTGNFFEVDEVGWDAIDLIDSMPMGKVITTLSSKHGLKAAKKTVQIFKQLSEKGLISSNKIKFKKHNVSVPKLFYMTLNLINNCNLRCQYCWNDSGQYSQEMGSIKMDKDIAFKAIDLLIEGSGAKKELVVDLYGGEPFMHWQLVKDVIQYCKSREKDTKKEFHFLLATNGTLLTLEKAKYLYDNGVDVAISIDGKKAIQDQMRPFKDGKGSYDTVIRNVNRIPAYIKKTMVARATLTPIDSDIVGVFKFLKGLGFDRIEICETEDICFGMTKDKEKYFFKTKKNVKDLKREYERLAKFYTEEILKGSFSYYNIYFNRFFKMLARLYHQNKIWGCCSAGVGQLATDAKGDIYPCTTFLDLKGFKIGDVFGKISKDSSRILLDTDITESAKCNDCFAKILCKGAGSCYNINYHYNKDKSIAEPVEEFCDIFKFKTKLMIAVIAEINEKKPHLLPELLRIPS